MIHLESWAANGKVESSIQTKWNNSARFMDPDQHTKPTKTVPCNYWTDRASHGWAKMVKTLKALELIYRY